MAGLSGRRFARIRPWGFLSGNQQRITTSLTINIDPVFTTISYEYSGVLAPSEDLNENGLLDPGEDLDETMAG